MLFRSVSQSRYFKHMTVRDVITLTRQHKISGLPVVDGKKVVGIVTNRDLRFETNLDQSICNIMTPKERLVTVREGASREEVMALLHQHRLERVLVVDDAFNLKGLITVKDIQKSSDHPLACKDEKGRLRVGAAVGVGEGTEERVAALAEAGVDVVVVDTAHGHSQGVLDRVTWVKKHFPNIQVIGGNIATGAAAKALVDAGADGVKVGIGPGSICTTRIVAGVGVPQISAVSNVEEALRGTGVPFIADGGIRYSGDISKAIAAGAYSVMLGGMFAGHDEGGGEVISEDGKNPRVMFYGMSSDTAMETHHGGVAEYRSSEGRTVNIPYREPVKNTVLDLLGGIRSTCTYVGAPTLKQLPKCTTFIRVNRQINDVFLK